MLGYDLKEMSLNLLNTGSTTATRGPRLTKPCLNDQYLSMMMTQSHISPIISPKEEGGKIIKGNSTQAVRSSMDDLPSLDMPPIDLFFQDANIPNGETSPFALHLQSFQSRQFFPNARDEFQFYEQNICKIEEIKQIANKTASTLSTTPQIQHTSTQCDSPKIQDDHNIWQQEQASEGRPEYFQDHENQLIDQCDLVMSEDKMENNDQLETNEGEQQLQFRFSGQKVKLPSGKQEWELQFTIFQEGAFTQVSDGIYLSVLEIIELYTDQIISSYDRSLNHIIFKKFKSYSALETFKQQFPQLAADPRIVSELNFIQSVFNPTGGFTDENNYIQRVMKNFTKIELMRFMRNDQTRTIYLQFSQYLLLMPFDLTYKKNRRWYTEKDFESQIIKLHDLARLYELADKFSAFD
ncbi:hypothetical protein FGO68_gene5197 [Halteria grandinella]|uniref:Uncharacterized protein n=1 Tax=Halteria grandinella TaxID=5974 RepID=A0A8J8NSK8_HALGN|nr:hypothetical protein FGO68_gene5197 [Halteria grandinella]